MTLEEVIQKYGPKIAKKIVDLLSRRPPAAAYGRPTHLKAALKWALDRDSFTAEELRDYLRSIDPSRVKDDKLSYTKTGILEWNYTTFAKIDDKYSLTPTAKEIAKVLSDGKDLTTLDLVVLRGMYLPMITKYGGPMARTYSIFTADPDRVWARSELEEEHIRCFSPLLRPRDPEKRAKWETGQYLMYLEELELVLKVGWGKYRLVVV